jgi:hypothetical protein
MSESPGEINALGCMFLQSISEFEGGVKPLSKKGKAIFYALENAWGIADL